MKILYAVLFDFQLLKYSSCNICTIVTIMRAVIEKEIALIMHETSLSMDKYIVV